MMCMNLTLACEQFTEMCALYNTLYIYIFSMFTTVQATAEASKKMQMMVNNQSLIKITMQFTKHRGSAVFILTLYTHFITDSTAITCSMKTVDK